MSQIGIGVLGATGYTGIELLRLLIEHPHVRIVALGSRSQAGESCAHVFPWWGNASGKLIDDATPAETLKQLGVQVLFACLPHGAFAERAESYLKAGIRVIDVSSDFRLHNADLYPKHYHATHPAPHLLSTSIYGLSEWCRFDIATAQLVANPGCYATCILLSLLPLLHAHYHDAHQPIIVTAMSGVSGAGKNPQSATHFVECGNSIKPYKVNQSHAHLGEIDQTLRTVTQHVPEIIMNPVLVPMARGILASIAVSLHASYTQEQLQQIYEQRYANEPFVRVLSAGELPNTQMVRGSNRCDIAVQISNHGKTALIYACIDNVLKGASGQALQNFNLMYQFPETTGLSQNGWAIA